MELPVRDLQIHVGLVTLPKDGNLIAPFVEMPVNTVRADIQRPVFEPLDGHILGIEGRVLYLRKRPDPIDARCLLGPKPVRVADTLIVENAISLLINVSRGTPAFRHRIHFSRHRISSESNALRHYVVGRV